MLLPSDEDSDTLVESSTDGESSESDFVAPKPSRNKKKAPTKYTSSKRKASTKNTRRAAKSVSPPSSESDSTEEESEEAEEDSSNAEEVPAKKEPRRNLETIQMDGYRDDGWSIHEDGTICFMKAKGSSSRKIAQELEREVSEVQIRIQEIMELAEEGGLTIESLGEIYAQDVKKKMKKRKEDSRPKHQAYAETVIDDSDEEPKIKSKDKGPSSIYSSSSIESILSYATFPPIVVPARDRPDMMHTLSRLYPDQKVFYPDSNFSVQDCRALAVAEARYRGQQYAYIQSEFANLTGQCLDTEVLKAKLAQSINPYDHTYVNWGGYRQ
ncbi:hypothetical protein F4813DRAFT_346604 [Daldinia decipiens]|uniref:uncharacterized protein n=1 Tax=Daldinia decipiens TaxID=326647 RepID=UPI0020C3402F|nr:uncharacterized protein F4813DRAFT_346604 [Daldinia decipiens]KAI1661144.1 hypothetical protein F4813DRAFT_346604 [Daldinia decipiens]